MKAWHVIAVEPRDDDEQYVNVFGPFKSEVDARAYAMDLANDNGWEHVEAECITGAEADDRATEKVLWPYQSEEQEED